MQMQFQTCGCCSNIKASLLHPRRLGGKRHPKLLLESSHVDHAGPVRFRPNGDRVPGDRTGEKWM